jgi:type VI secretion system protein ImpG
MAAEGAFLGYYLNEIEKLRIEGSAFARTHKHLAGHLDFDDRETDDPQVARLIESFAFLTARLQQQFDDEFPQIPTALLAQLHPQLVAPIPSAAIADFRVSPKQERSIKGVVVPRETALFATAENGDECRFRTGFALPLWPVEVSQVSMPAPRALACLDRLPDVEACVRVRLSCMGPTRTFGQFSPATLQFYVDGDRSGRFRLFELLCKNLIGVAVVDPAEPDRPAMISPGLGLRPMGLEPDEAMLPYPDASHHGYRLLQEYFNFPDKFMFVELTGLGEGTLGTGREIDLLFLLDAEPVEPIRVETGTLRLGCVPIINLFDQTSEPIRLDHVSVDYTLEPDIRAARSTEIHTVLGVTRSHAGKDRAEAIQPYFGGMPDADDSGSLRWLARRRPETDPSMAGTEVELSFVDPALNPTVPAEDVLFAQLLCTNRMLPRHLSSATPLEVETDLPIDRIRCLAKPTPPADPPMAGENLWRLVSHLSLNKLSLVDGPDGLEALKEILYLYSGSDENSRKRRQIDGLRSLRMRPVVRRLGDRNWRGFVRGTEIRLTFREENFAGGSAYLLGSVLDRFFALYANVNTFTELVIARENHDEEWKRWPARVGERLLL